jgi:tyrosyl-tRNA synthetase
MNDKMGGDLDKIKVVGQYLIEVWSAAGMDMSGGRVVFKWASDEITSNAATYWPKMLDIARRFNVTRIKKCCQIMGRLEGNLTAAQILYPLMQCTDVFFLKADVCQLGVDQRKVNMLAREYCDAAKIKFKPVILSHHMLYGLKKGQEKMSKSDPDSAIFMEDAPEDVERKINAAYCPRTVEGAAAAAAAEEEDAGKESMQLVKDDLKNPCLDYIQHIVLCPAGSTFEAGGVVYDSFAAVNADFLEGRLSETDLKTGLIAAINRILEPVRRHFHSNAAAKELLEKVLSHVTCRVGRAMCVCINQPRCFQVHAYKKIGTPVTRAFRRLDAVACGVVPAGSHVVFAPAPTASLTLQHCVDVITQLASAPRGQGRVLFLSDWSALVISACDADAKVIAASFDVLLAALRAIAPAVMDGVVIVRQSAAILADPSNYWISVINVGRHFNLNVIQEGYDDSKPAGQVIRRMMMVADIVSMSPASVSYIAEDAFAATESRLIGAYFAEGGIPLPAPAAVACPRVVVALQDVEAIHATENTEYFVMDDAKQHGKAKMKKAFCEPGNLAFCPPIALVSFFALQHGAGSVAITRTPENGGDITYETAAAIAADFSSGALHPGDLKEYAGKTMSDVLQRIADATKDKDIANSKKALQAFAKKQSKS